MICTECGKSGATLRRDDAADEKHWFHPACWKRFMRWLGGEDAGRSGTARLPRMVAK